MSSQCMCMLSKITQMTPKTQLQIWKYVKCVFFQCHITATCPVSYDKTSFNSTLFIYYTAFYQLHKKKKFHDEWCVGEKSTLRWYNKKCSMKQSWTSCYFLNWSMKQILWRDLLITALSDFVCWNVLFPIVNFFSRAVIKRIEQQLVCFSSTSIYREIVRFGNISSHLFGTTIKYYTNSNVVHTHLV